MNKVYERINWENYPSIHTPINEKNLNKLDFAADALDNRIINLDTAKVDKSSIQTNVADWTMDSDTGIITITKVNGEKVIFDLNIEKIPIEFKLTPEGILIMITDDGTQFKADIGSMIPILTFNSSSEIQVTVTGTGINKVYSFSIIKNSITEDKLEANYLADIKTEVAKAQSSSKTATDAATTATNMANNAKSYSENAAASKMSAETAASISETNSQQASTSANNAAKSEANAKLYMNNALNSSLDAETSKNQSDLNANSALQSATLAQSYAVGGTNTRTDEDTDNAKYYYGQLKANQSVIIYNDLAHTNDSNGLRTANDIVSRGFAMGMIRGNTDNPVSGSVSTAPWFHILTMGWNNSNSWNSQLALGVSAGTGLYYRTKSGSLPGTSWTRVLDSQNYEEYMGKTSNKISLTMPNCVIMLPQSTNYVSTFCKQQLTEWAKTTQCNLYIYADDIDDNEDELNVSITEKIMDVYNANASVINSADSIFICIPIYYHNQSVNIGNMEDYWDNYKINCIYELFNTFNKYGITNTRKVYVIGIIPDEYEYLTLLDIIQYSNFKREVRSSYTNAGTLIDFTIFNCVQLSNLHNILKSYVYSKYNNLPVTVMDLVSYDSSFTELTIPGYRYNNSTGAIVASTAINIVYSFSPNRLKLKLILNGSQYIRQLPNNSHIEFSGVDMIPEYLMPIRIPLGSLKLFGGTTYNEAYLDIYSSYLTIGYHNYSSNSGSEQTITNAGYYNIGAYENSLEVEIDTTI